MDIGIPNVRSFLAKSDRELVVGQLITVCISNCQIEGHIATVALSMTESIKFKQNVELNIATILPGTKVHVNVTNVLSAIDVIFLITFSKRVNIDSCRSVLAV